MKNHPEHFERQTLLTDFFFKIQAESRREVVYLRVRAVGVTRHSQLNC